MIPYPFPAMKWGNAEHLTRALFNQGEVWITAKSEVCKIKEMDASHALNTLLMVTRLADELPVENIQSSKLYGALYDRVVSSLPDAPYGPVAYFQGPSNVEAKPPTPPPSIVSKRVGISYGSIFEILEETIAVNKNGEQRRLLIDYVDSNGNRTHRAIEPIATHDSKWVSARDVEKDALRTFTISNIERCEVV